MQQWFNIGNIQYTCYHLKRLKEKNHMIVSIDLEKALDKFQ